MTAETQARALTLDFLLELLSSRGLLTLTQVRDVRVRASEQRARLQRQSAASLGTGAAAVGPLEIVASLGLVATDGTPLDADRLAALVASEAGLPYHKIDPLALDMELVARTLSRPFALRHVALPVTVDASGTTVAVANPFDHELTFGLARVIRGEVRRVVSSRDDILKAITEIYGFKRSIDAAAKESVRDPGASDFEQLVKLRNVTEIEATDQHVVNAVDFLLRYAFDQRASDIHIEPRRGDSQVRLRIDGVLHDTHLFPRAVHPALVSRVKTLARMDIAEKRRPQDGRIKTSFAAGAADSRQHASALLPASGAESTVELRVSTLPVAFGEKVVLRIFDPDTLLGDLGDLGFEATQLTTFERWIGEPHGLILVTGPTGSGKTTTLYTTLKTLADAEVNVTTVEDPIEMVTDRFNQVAVQPKAGIDFPTALRTILRQDPDIIMVGEIRDGETAEMAIQAALTGHLVLSTLHTNDSVGAVTRLLDLGVPSFLVGSTLLGVMAQRLMRRICKECKAPAPLTEDQLAGLGIGEAERARFTGTCAGRGCPSCRGTGYYGRVGIFEVLDVTPELASLVSRRAPEDALRHSALGQGLRSLRDAALDRLAQGVTTAEEVVRVTGLKGVNSGEA